MLAAMRSSAEPRDVHNSACSQNELRQPCSLWGCQGVTGQGWECVAPLMWEGSWEIVHLSDVPMGLPVSEQEVDQRDLGSCPWTRTSLGHHCLVGGEMEVGWEGGSQDSANQIEFAPFGIRL